MGEAAGRVQRCDEFFEGQRLMRHIGLRRLMQHDQIVAEAVGGRWAQPQRHRVHETTDEPVQRRIGAVRDGRADDDLGQVREVCQIGRNHGEDGGEGRGAALTRQGIEARGSIRRPSADQCRPVVVLHRRARAVSGQAVQRGRIGQPRPPIGQVGAIVCLPLPARVIAVAQRRCFGQGTGGQKILQLIKEDAQGYAVKRNVMHRDEPPVTGRVQPDQGAAQDRPSGQIERPVDAVGFGLPQCGVEVRDIGQIEIGQRFGGGRADLLSWRALRADITTAQHVVSDQHLGQKRAQPVRIQRSCNVKDDRDRIELPRRADPVDGPDPLLRKRQRRGVAGFRLRDRRQDSVIRLPDSLG